MHVSVFQYFFSPFNLPSPPSPPFPFQLRPSQVTPATNLVFFSMLMFFGHYWSLKHTTAFYIVPCIPFLQCSVESPQHQCDGASASLLRAACIPREGRGDARAGQQARVSFLAFPSWRLALVNSTAVNICLSASLTTKSL